MKFLVVAAGLLAMAMASEAVAQNRCAKLAADYDSTLRAIEAATSAKKVADANARNADRQALLGALASNKCPTPDPLTSDGYSSAASICAFARAFGPSSPETAANAPAPLRHLFMAPADVACDAKNWVYYTPES